MIKERRNNLPTITLMAILVLSMSLGGITQVQAEPAIQNLDPIDNDSIVPLAGPDPDSGGDTVDNGVVQIGVNNGGHLDRPSDGVGLRPLGGPDALSPGCDCEGWGVAANGTVGPVITGFANQALGTGGIEVDSFSSTADSAVSVVKIPTLAAPVLTVEHDYHPSADTDKLYEVTVTITNESPAPIGDIFYRRVMDWDIPPTEFDEFVTVQGTGTTTKLIASGNDGFMPSNQLAEGVLAGDGPIVYEIGPGVGTAFLSDFEDLGPSDHGSVFDLNFGTLAAGESFSFNIYYGVAENEDDAEAALAAIGAELFSLGQSNTADGPTLGTPWTFIWAFEGVGGEPIFPPVVGGELLPIDNTALFLAGLSQSAVWMIPTLAGIVGAGVIIRRKLHRD